MDRHAHRGKQHQQQVATDVQALSELGGEDFKARDTNHPDSVLRQKCRSQFRAKCSQQVMRCPWCCKLKRYVKCTISAARRDFTNDYVPA